MSVANNLMCNADSSLPSSQYPENGHVYTYIASSSGLYNKMMFFGLQKFIKTNLVNPITEKMVAEAADFHSIFGTFFNRSGWSRVVEKYAGKIPVQIYAVPEGTMVPAGMPMLTILNTDSEFAWLTSFIKSAIIHSLWYPTLAATHTKYIKNLIHYYLKYTGDTSLLEFKLHNFVASTSEVSEIVSMTHLVNFGCADTTSGVISVAEYCGNNMAVFDNSEYNIDTCQALELVRFDSCEDTDTFMETVKRLDRQFDSVLNSKRYKVLNTARLIFNNANYKSIKEILATLEANKYSADNVSFRLGNDFMKDVEYDAQKFIDMNAGDRFAFMDSPDKSSMMWHLMSYKSRRTSAWYALDFSKDIDDEYIPQMEPVFVGGSLVRDQKFADIRLISNS